MEPIAADTRNSFEGCILGKMLYVQDEDSEFGCFFMSLPVRCLLLVCVSVETMTSSFTGGDVEVYKTKISDSSKTELNGSTTTLLDCCSQFSSLSTSQHVPYCH